jgi:hypothetical protein
VSGERETQGEAGQLVVCEAVDGGKQNLFGGALFVLVLASDLLGQVVGERVWVKVDEGAEKTRSCAALKVAGAFWTMRSKVADALFAAFPCGRVRLRTPALSAFIFLSASSALRSCSSSYSFRCCS